MEAIGDACRLIVQTNSAAGIEAKLEAIYGNWGFYDGLQGLSDIEEVLYALLRDTGREHWDSLSEDDIDEDINPDGEVCPISAMARVFHNPGSILEAGLRRIMIEMKHMKLEANTVFARAASERDRMAPSAANETTVARGSFMALAGNVSSLKDLEEQTRELYDDLVTKDSEQSSKLARQFTLKCYHQRRELEKALEETMAEKVQKLQKRLTKERAEQRQELENELHERLSGLKRKREEDLVAERSAEKKRKLEKKAKEERLLIDADAQVAEVGEQLVLVQEHLAELEAKQAAAIAARAEHIAAITTLGQSDNKNGDDDVARVEDAQVQDAVHRSSLIGPQGIIARMESRTGGAENEMRRLQCDRKSIKARRMAIGEGPE